MKYGVQMYSLRDVAEFDLKKALEAAAEKGYKFVEFAGFFGNSAETVKSWLDELGLEAIGSHTGPEDLEADRIEASIAYQKTIGSKYLTLPYYADYGTNEKFDHILELLNDAGERLKKEGITLCYHNHSLEFYKTPAGRMPMEELIAKTNVGLEPDVFWIENADRDALAFLEENKERIKLVHLKDGKINREIEGSYEGWFREAKGVSLGLGDVPVADIVRWADKNGVPVIVESEGINPTGPEEVGRCMDYLKSIE